MRINKYLALCGLGSRREVEKLITDKKISVNGETCTNLATLISENDTVTFNGKKLQNKELIYLAFHKPINVLTTKKDFNGTKTKKTIATIYDILPERFHHLHYVGRLDKMSEGLLLMTNDGSASNQIQKPKFKVEKEYIVELNKNFNLDFVDKLIKGFTISTGFAKMKSVKIIGQPKRLKIILTQGLKKQIREMLSKLDYKVTRLVRIRIGNVTLGKLKPGEFRRLKKITT